MAQASALRYVALGDSYTIGTAVSVPDRWPNRLVGALGATPPTLRLAANLAVNGYTSADVLERELPQLDRFGPEFTSLLVGVNDVVRCVPIDVYRANVERILGSLLRRVPADRMVALSTPDYTVTPQGGAYGDPLARRAAIVEHNAILAGLSADRGIAFVDVFEVSLRAADDPLLVADDGLHPSGAQYAVWVERIAPVVERLLGR
jgi:lysophospholipase L1-like esterase